MVDVAGATVSFGAVTNACLSQECLSSIHTDRTTKNAMCNHLLVSTIETGEKYCIQECENWSSVDIQRQPLNEQRFPTR